MNILHFSTDDISGGAAKAAYRIHSALRRAGHSSRMIVRNKLSQDDDVSRAPLLIWRSRLKRLRRELPLFAHNQSGGSGTFNFDAKPDVDTGYIFRSARGDVDVINLHWITNLLTVRTIGRIFEHYRCPIVWTLMDQEPLTGGCHYSFGCEGFKNQCGRCPQLDSSREHDRSRTTWLRKRNYLRDLPIAFVSPDHWSAQRLKESSLFSKHRLERIPYAIDTSVFRPFDQQAARDLLHVPQDKKVIFFGSASLDDERKGMSYLADALHRLSSRLDDIGGPLKREAVFLLVAGNSDKNSLHSWPFPHRHLGYLRDDITLALAYQAADIFVCPSVEDAGPMMIPESMLCGTPVVAFKSMADPDVVETMKTGYLAEYKDSEDLTNGIHTLLAESKLREMGAEARSIAVEVHSPEFVATRYSELYQSLLSELSPSRLGQTVYAT